MMGIFAGRWLLLGLLSGCWAWAAASNLALPQLNHHRAFTVEEGAPAPVYALALDAVQAMRAALPGKDVRPGFAHCELVDPEDYPRFAQ